MQLPEKLNQKILKAKSDPCEAFCYIMSLLRGKFYKLRCNFFAPQIQIGARFRLRSGINIQGPGKVIIGDDVTVDLSFLKIPSIITHTKEASVIIGKGTYLGGTRISCANRVQIGKEGLLGSTTIIDSDIIPTKNTSITENWLEKYTSPIEIGDYFWAGTNAFILKGTKIGNECVLGAGGLVYNKTFPDRSLLIGNPARKIGSTR